MEKVGIIGLGYVGLPLAVEFGKKFSVVGFDINIRRIEELKAGFDRTQEVSTSEFEAAKKLSFSSDYSSLSDVNIYIVTVPTPVDVYKKPNLTPLLKASETVGKVLKKGDIVIYESTVYPGCTEEDCVPVLEKISGLKYNIDFFCGYSPERINPDKNHTLSKIKKVVSGSNAEITKRINDLYLSIISAGTHVTSSIKVAEASKVIENSQRDINIAFINELALIFDKMGINTSEVLEAAGTKWNFLPFKPGLVGGHCIGVDPYYLTHKAESLGYHPQIILAGRRINDSMGGYIANKIIKLMTRKNHLIFGSNVLILGITFKENCPDIRNTKVIDIVNELKEFGINVDVYDPMADPVETKQEYNLDLIKEFKKSYQAIVLAVAHEKIKEIDLMELKNENTVIYDIKSFLSKEIVDASL